MREQLRNFTFVDLFSGAGGLSEGFREAGFQALAGSDNDPDAMATYALNFGDAQAIVGDIRAPAIFERILDVARSADVIVGGPPCQAFSQVRNHSRLIDDPRNSLYRDFVRVVAETLPKAFLVENVTGMDQMGVRDQIVTDLSLDGEYTVLPQVLDAADFSVPQTRKRLFFVGVHRSIDSAPPFIVGSNATASIELVRRIGKKSSVYKVEANHDLISGQLLEALQDAENCSIVTASEAISDLAQLPVGNRNDLLAYEDLPAPMSAYQRRMRDGAGTSITNVQVPRINNDTILRLKGVPQGGNHRDLKVELLERYITGQKWGQSNGTGKLSRRHFYAYRRLHPDIWAWTLNTKADSVYHYKYPRALSVREFARLQSFPDRFQFTTDPRKGMIPGRHDEVPHILDIARSEMQSRLYWLVQSRKKFT